MATSHAPTDRSFRLVLTQPGACGRRRPQRQRRVARASPWCARRHDWPTGAVGPGRGGRGGGEQGVGSTAQRVEKCSAAVWPSQRALRAEKPHQVFSLNALYI